MFPDLLCIICLLLRLRDNTLYGPTGCGGGVGRDPGALHAYQQGRGRVSGPGLSRYFRSLVPAGDAEIVGAATGGPPVRSSWAPKGSGGRGIGRRN